VRSIKKSSLSKLHTYTQQGRGNGKGNGKGKGKGRVSHGLVEHGSVLEQYRQPGMFGVLGLNQPEDFQRIAKIR
jgi:hypothetical protein